MYTSMSIASLGASTFPRPEPYVRTTGEDYNLTTIPAEDTLRRGPLLARPNLLLQVDDIDGSRSKTLHRSRRGFESSDLFKGYSGRSDLICPNGMTKTERRVDPLNPMYALPSYKPLDPAIPKFTRDSFDVRDIDGARPRPAKATSVRNMLRTDDIEGADSHWRAKLQKRTTVDTDLRPVRDDYPSKYKSTRKTNPLDPEYFIYGERLSEQFQPRPIRRFITENKLLQTADINHPPPEFDTRPRREYRNTNFVLDIEGAQADTLIQKRNRGTNPLLPVYASLDAGEVLEMPVTCLVPADLVVSPAFKPTSNQANGFPPPRKSLVGSDFRQPSAQTVSESSAIGHTYVDRIDLETAARKSTTVSSSPQISGRAQVPLLSSARSSRGSFDYASEVQSVRDLA